MSEAFEVPSPHEKHLEHTTEHAHGRGDNFASRIAVMTALMATLGAMLSYQAGSTESEAAMDKNNAAIFKTEAANQWNYYQAKSNKQNLAELSITLTSGETQEKYRQEVARYKDEKAEIKVEAEKLEAQAKAADAKSELEMHVHERWALATTLLQIAIAMSAITLLTRKRWLLVGVYGAAAIGVGVGVMGYLHL